MEPLDLLSNLPHRIVSSGQEILLRDCPFCHLYGINTKEHPWHLYVNRFTGVYHCKICNSRGDFTKLKRALGFEPKKLVRPKTQLNISLKDVKEWSIRLFRDREALEYLRSRNISVDTQKEFLVGVCERYGKKMLSIPYIIEGELKGVKYRSIEGKIYLTEPGSNLKDILFNQDILKNEPDEVVIVEGELDALSLHSQGYKNVVSLSSGAGQAATGNFIDLLKKAKKILLCLDNDTEGKKATHELARRLDYNCRKISLPNGIKDISEYFQHGYTLETFLSLPREEIHLENIEPLSKAIDSINEEIEGEAVIFQIFTPWEGMNKILRRGSGITEGDLVVISGLPKQGKTTLLIQWACFLAKSQIPVLFYCLEMSKRRLVPKFLSSYLGKPFTEKIEDILKIKEDDPPIYLVDSAAEKAQKSIFQLIRDSIKRYGIKVVMFDNLHFLISDVNHTPAEVARITKEFKLISEEMKITTFLVAHVTKLSDETNPPTSSNLRDSGMIRANADFVFILHRKREFETTQDGTRIPVFKEVGSLILDSCRYGETGHITLEFIPDCNLFREVALDYESEL